MVMWIPNYSVFETLLNEYFSFTRKDWKGEPITNDFADKLNFFPIIFQDRYPKKQAGMRNRTSNAV